MNRTEHDERLPGTVARIRADAVIALQSWSADLNPEYAALLLDTWRRRDEMTDEDVTAVLESMFPEQPENVCRDEWQPAHAAGTRPDGCATCAG